MKQTVLTISDEVNAKFSNLDLSLRQRLVKQFKYADPKARYLPSVRLGRWDGKVAFFQLGGSTYINMLEDILPIIAEAGYDIEINDARTYRTTFEFSPVHEDTFSYAAWPKGHPEAGQPVKFRDYQLNIVNNFLSNPQSLQEVATGAGKTLMTAALSYSVQDYGRTVVIVPSKSLVVQTEADFRNLGLDVGVYFSERKEVGHRHTICTWQSLGAMYKATQEGKANIQDFLLDTVAVIVDECFDGNEKVLTPDGYKPIKELRPGDKVINYSESTGQFKEDVVVKQHKNLSKSSQEKMYELEFDNGDKIRVTGNHKFLTNLGWCRADELTDKHEIISKT